MIQPRPHRAQQHRPRHQHRHDEAHGDAGEDDQEGAGRGGGVDPAQVHRRPDHGEEEGLAELRPEPRDVGVRLDRGASER